MHFVRLAYADSARRIFTAGIRTIHIPYQTHSLTYSWLADSSTRFGDEPKKWKQMNPKRMENNNTFNYRCSGARAARSSKMADAHTAVTQHSPRRRFCTTFFFFFVLFRVCVCSFFSFSQMHNVYLPRYDCVFGILLCLFSVCEQRGIIVIPSTIQKRLSNSQSSSSSSPSLSFATICLVISLVLDFFFLFFIRRCFFCRF